MAVNKLLPFANGVGSNVVDYATWSALSQILGQGFVTGVARSDYANRLFSQGALASYILGQFVVDETNQDADLNESVFYVNFKNALTAYIKGNAVSLDTVQTVGGVKTFTSSPVVPTPTSGDNSTKVASTAFVQNALDKQAVQFDGAQTLTDAQKTQARANVGAAADSDVVKVTAQTLTDAQKAQARSNIAPSVEQMELEYISNNLVTEEQFNRCFAAKYGNLLKVQVNCNTVSGQTASGLTTIGRIKNVKFLSGSGGYWLAVCTSQSSKIWLLQFSNDSANNCINIQLYPTTTTANERIGYETTIFVE